jgi:uncharacterized membrane protein YeiB
MADSIGRHTDAPVRPQLGPPTHSGSPTKARFLGVDVTRGVALLTMLAANVFDPFTADGKPTIAVMTVLGRSATLFALVAGISLAFMTGGRNPVRGGSRKAVAAGIAVRALLIGAIGLALGPLGQGELEVILAFYGLCFLLAIPLIGLRARTLAIIAGVLAVVSPLILLAASYLGVTEPAFDAEELTFTAPLHDPLGFVAQLFITGYFPVAIYMIYICAGMAIGRLDLSSTKVAVRLLVGGLGIAVAAWTASSILLFRLGGLNHLQGVASGSQYHATVRDIILWNPEQRVASWWWLALRAHHTGSTIDVLHTLGSAIAVLGAVLLLTRLPAARRFLWPIGVAGSMTLTIYAAHIPIIGSGVLGDQPYLMYILLVAAALGFAVLWQRRMGQGPLERLVARASGRTRDLVAKRLADRDRRTSPDEGHEGRQVAMNPVT